MKKFLFSFTYAFKGLQYAFRTQLNFKVHSISALSAIALGYWLNIGKHDWLWIFLAIGLVLTAELFNTALEVLVDLVSPEYHPKAGVVKDVSAAAVLITALLSIAIGMMVFLPKLF
ncbi:diacylglycerol kinase family protein [Flavihumibacter sp. R14]|nr:diacylglycerol kinase family protein [Flavihumibacter soli]